MSDLPIRVGVAGRHEAVYPFLENHPSLLVYIHPFLCASVVAVNKMEGCLAQMANVHSNKYSLILALACDITFFFFTSYSIVL